MCVLGSNGSNGRDGTYTHYNILLLYAFVYVFDGSDGFQRLHVCQPFPSRETSATRWNLYGILCVSSPLKRLKDIDVGAHSSCVEPTNITPTCRQQHPPPPGAGEEVMEAAFNRHCYLLPRLCIEFNKNPENMHSPMHSKYLREIFRLEIRFLRLTCFMMPVTFQITPEKANTDCKVKIINERKYMKKTLFRALQVFEIICSQSKSSTSQ
ncbi:hypothetical protein QTP88_012340 [Uroleucon formosanum]